MTSKTEQEYWSQRYNEGKTGWDLGTASTPLAAYIDQLKDKNQRILIPGAGNAHEAEYLFNLGFKNIYVLDISPNPLKKFKERNPSFPEKNLIHGDFFKHEEKYDLILEQTFFCSFLPTTENRTGYAKKMSELLNAQGKLIGVWFSHELIKNSQNRPFGGSREEYLHYFEPYFTQVSFEPCYNSSANRKELFGQLATPKA